MKSIVCSAVFLIAGIAGGIAWSEWTSPATSVIASGDILQSIDADEVRMLSFSSATFTATAQRSIRGGGFDLLFTSADNSASMHCRLRGDLSETLEAFTHIVARRALSVSERETQFPVHLGNLLVQTFSTEPDGPIMVFTNRAGDAIAFISEHYRAQVDVPVAAFRRFNRGCESQR